MTFELTISRVGALAASASASRREPPLPLRGASLAAAFRKQANLIASSSFFLAAEAAILAAAREFDPAAKYSPGAIENELKSIDVFVSPNGSMPSLENSQEPNEHLVGLLPSRRMEVVIGGVAWIVRVRASITACALEQNCGSPKLWWTFEGIPSASGQYDDHTEKNSSELLKATNEMAQVGISGLYSAYFESLKELDGKRCRKFDLLPDRIRVGMADSTDTALSRFMDTFYSDQVSMSDILQSNTYENIEARQLLDKFKTFVSSATNRPVKITNTDYFVESDAVGSRGLICRQFDPISREIVLTGITQSNSFKLSRPPYGNKIIDGREGFLRAFSAARPISAMLASREGTFLDNRLNLS
jgi:hypothetical protein